MLPPEIAQQGSGAACCNGGQGQGRGQLPLFPAKDGGGQSAGDEEHQVHQPGVLLLRPKNQGQPQHQQTAAANPQSGKTAQQDTNANAEDRIIERDSGSLPIRS